jgi:transposase
MAASTWTATPPLVHVNMHCRATVERTIRPIALQRKNALFAGHDAGAQNWAMLASLIETCKLNKIEPHSNLAGVLTAIVNGHKQKHIDQLLPWNFKG